MLEDAAYLLMRPETFIFCLFDAWGVLDNGCGAFNTDESSCCGTTGIENGDRNTSNSSGNSKNSSRSSINKQIESIELKSFRMSSKLSRYLSHFRSKIKPSNKISSSGRSSKLALDQMTRKAFFFILALLDEYIAIDRPWRELCPLQKALFEEIIAHLDLCGYKK